MAPVGSDLHTRVSTLPDGRAVITRRVHAPVGVIWSVLADGWQHTDWVAGSSIDGAVEPRWPDPGSRVRHLSGRWRVVSNDHTEVIATEPGRELRLATHRRWSSGTNQVRIYVSPGGTPASSFVRIVEDTVTGPGTMLPRPVRQLLITRRNTDALHRLASLAEVRHRESILNAELGNVANDAAPDTHLNAARVGRPAVR